MPIKVSELFYSVQGEGRYMGVPSIFLRTFGCNFHCQGFGMARGQLSTERANLNPAEYNEYGQLPLVTTGCDSYASWDPRFKHLSPMMEIDDIVGRIKELLPYKEWQDEHLVITGGEPLLGWQKQYIELLDKMPDLQEVTFETNGTQAINSELASYLRSQFHPAAVTFSVSAKLPCSGHTFEEAIKPEIVVEYETVGYTYLKFVVANAQDVTDAEQAAQMYRDEGFMGPIYLMPVGGVESVYSLNNKAVALMALERGWRYSDRLQVPLFKNAWAT